MVIISSKKKLPKSQISLTISVQAKDFRHAFEAEAREAGERTKITGFRPGKAPIAKVVEQIGRKTIEAGAIDHALNHAYMEALAQEKIIPVSQPDVKLTSFNAPSDEDTDDKEALKFDLTVDVLPEVNVSGYKKLHVKTPQKEGVKKDELDKVVDYLKKQQASLKEVDAEVPAAKDMWVEIGYEGSIGGVKRTDMANKQHPLIIGEGQLIPGFEDQLIGMKKGDEKTFDIVFPKDYQAKELAGKKAQFTVKLNDLKEVILPAEDETFAKQFGHNNFSDLLEAIEKDLVKEKEAQYKGEVEKLVAEAAIKMFRFDLPSSLVERETERLVNESKERLVQMKLDWNTYLAQTGQTEEKVKEEIAAQAEKNVRIGLILGEIMKEEGIKESEKAGREAMDTLINISTK